MTRVVVERGTREDTWNAACKISITLKSQDPISWQWNVPKVGEGVVEPQSIQYAVSIPGSNRQILCQNSVHSFTRTTVQWPVNDSGQWLKGQWRPLDPPLVYCRLKHAQCWTGNRLSTSQKSFELFQLVQMKETGSSKMPSNIDWIDFSGDFFFLSFLRMGFKCVGVIYGKKYKTFLGFRRKAIGPYLHSPC